MKKHLLIVLSALTALMVSCQKESTDNHETPTGENKICGTVWMETGNSPSLSLYYFMQDGFIKYELENEKYITSVVHGNYNTDGDKLFLSSVEQTFPERASREFYYNAVVEGNYLILKSCDQNGNERQGVVEGEFTCVRKPDFDFSELVRGDDWTPIQGTRWDWSVETSVGTTNWSLLFLSGNKVIMVTQTALPAGAYLLPAGYSLDGDYTLSGKMSDGTYDVTIQVFGSGYTASVDVTLTGKFDPNKPTMTLTRSADSSHIFEDTTEVTARRR